MQILPHQEEILRSTTTSQQRTCEWSSPQLQKRPPLKLHHYHLLPRRRKDFPSCSKKAYVMRNMQQRMELHILQRMKLTAMKILPMELLPKRVNRSCPHSVASQGYVQVAVSMKKGKRRQQEVLHAVLADKLPSNISWRFQQDVHGEPTTAETTYCLRYLVQ